jgi:hypothetical protein
MSINDEVEYFVIRDSPATLLTVNAPVSNPAMTIAVPGVQGIPGKVAVGSTTTGAPGTNALVSLFDDPSTGTSVLSFTIPRGDITDLSIGTVVTGSPDSLAAVTITGTAPNRILNLTIPQGATGSTGSPANLSIGTVTQGAPGSPPAVSVTGTAPNYTLNFTIPKGETGNASTVASTSITDSTTVGRAVLTATDAPAARSAIGAGTSSLVLGTSSTTAAAGDHTHADLTSATDSATANTIVKRDGSGNFSAAAPTAISHVTRKDYVDNSITAIARRKSGLHTQTAYGITQADEGKVLYYTTDAAAVTYTIPDSTTTITTGTRLEILRPLSGVVTISPATGVTLYGVDGAGTKTISTVGGSAFLTKLSANAWSVVGDITSATDTAVVNATATATASTIVKRDSAGSASMVSVSLSNAPASADQATRKDYVDSAVSTHNSATVVHGATGAVVGTTNSQTLTNKTLTAPAVSNYLDITEIAAPAATGNAATHRLYVDSTTEGLYWKSSALTRRAATSWPAAAAHYASSALLVYGDVYYNTVLTAMLMWNGTVWIQANGPLVTTSTFRVNTLNANIALIPVGFEVRETDTLRELRWDGTKWWKTNGITEILYSAVVTGGSIANGAALTSLHSTTINLGALVAGPINVYGSGNWTGTGNAAATCRISVGGVTWANTRLQNFNTNINTFSHFSFGGPANCTVTGNNLVSWGAEVDAGGTSMVFYQNWLEIKF